jgi:nicotinamide mononucleotide (NMN) deamidase PncC
VAAVSRQFPGDRAAVRRATVTAALALVLSELSAVTP